MLTLRVKSMLRLKSVGVGGEVEVQVDGKVEVIKVEMRVAIEVDVGVVIKCDSAKITPHFVHAGCCFQVQLLAELAAALRAGRGNVR
jgi:hypothetical protein